MLRGEHGEMTLFQFELLMDFLEIGILNIVIRV